MVATTADGLCAHHPSIGDLTLAGDGWQDAMCCDNETDTQTLWGVAATTACPKDGIGRYVLHDEATVGPAGTKGALRYDLDVAGGGTAEIILRLCAGAVAGDLDDVPQVLAMRQDEADTFYADLGADNLARAAAATLLWSRKFYHWSVERWLDGDPAHPARAVSADWA